MKKLLLILFFVIGFTTQAIADGFCEGPLGTEKAIESAAGVITFSGAEGSIGDCSFAPDEYQVTIYEMSLCTSIPTAPTTSSAYDTSSCSVVINSPSGQTVNMAAGTEVALTDFTAPPIGTYTHGHMVIGNSFGIKVTKQFTNTMFRHDTSATGNYCWTLADTEHTSDFSGVPTDPTPFASCGDSGDAAPAMYTEILDAFGSGVYNYGPVDVQSGTITAYLVTDSNDQLVNAVKTADRLFGIQVFTTPVEVKPDSSSFTISLGVNQASSMQMTDKGVDDQYQVIAFGSGPFSSFMTVE